MVVLNKNIVLHGDISQIVIEDALEKLLSSGHLRLSERNRKFITFVVKEAIAGRSERIKAYSIGVDVFGRGEDFDPNVDPIVRIEATRLRSALDAYYSGPGAGDDIKIVMKPGSYIPIFESLSPIASDRPRLISSGPCPMQSRRVVLRHGTDPRNRQAHGCGALLVNALAQRLMTDSYRVFFGSVPRPKQRARSIKETPIDDDSIFCVEISILPMTGGRRHAWSISNLKTGELHGLGNMDQLSNDLASASSVNELTERIFGSVTSVVTAAWASAERQSHM